VKAIVRKVSKPERIVFLEQITSAQLVDLLRGSFALVSASRMEGFDYPVLEAKAEGLPTIISDIPVHRELHGDSSLYCDLSKGPQSLCFVLELLLWNQHLWKQLSVNGFVMANRFSICVQQQEIQVFEWKGFKAFFKTSDGIVPFDLFAAAFYLLSRYEEYLSQEKDQYGRFPAEASLAFKAGFLAAQGPHDA
jgi:hypothetical protein